MMTVLAVCLDRVGRKLTFFAPRQQVFPPRLGKPIYVLVAEANCSSWPLTQGIPRRNTVQPPFLNLVQ
jgi:hypothetical protein